MKEKVIITLRNQRWEVAPGKTARDTIKEIGLTPHSYLVVRDNELISEDTILRPGDEIMLVAVISGG